MKTILQAYVHKFSTPEISEKNNLQYKGDFMDRGKDIKKRLCMKALLTYLFLNHILKTRWKVISMAILPSIIIIESQFTEKVSPSFLIFKFANFSIDEAANNIIYYLCDFMP